MLPVCRGIQSGSSWQILVSLDHRNPAGTPGDGLYLSSPYIIYQESQWQKKHQHEGQVLSEIVTVVFSSFDICICYDKYKSNKYEKIQQGNLLL